VGEVAHGIAAGGRETVMIREDAEIGEIDDSIAVGVAADRQGRDQCRHVVVGVLQGVDAFLDVEGARVGEFVVAQDQGVDVDGAEDVALDGLVVLGFFQGWPAAE